MERQRAAGLGYLYHVWRVLLLYYFAHGPPKSGTDMITQAAAILVGLVAVLWYFDDTEKHLGSIPFLCRCS
ncbi:hypothetical protein ElyMa_002115900 [Elysia marginata]|uniref:Uncharacterized protein n=1 Tax=Elysia marginata TaxID=1093978 RepID=A0AAV4FH33_9GAST|nr:hypothetical protein ElyMa_002115900 [Elysia marginata]